MADKKSLSDLGALTSEPSRGRRGRRDDRSPAAADEAAAPEADADVTEAPAPVSTQVRRSRRSCASSSSTSMAALTPPAAARTPLPASG